MTTPAPPATTPPPATQQPPPITPVQAGADTAAMLALASAAAFMAYPTAIGVYSQLAAQFSRAGITGPVLRAIINIQMQYPADSIEGVGSATRWAAQANIARRSAFFVAAARRVQAGLAEARSRGEPASAALPRLAKLEFRYFRQHYEANQQRIIAASAVDGAVFRWGPVLGWKAVNDSRTSAECKAADGKNFLASSPPAIGYPGTVHPHCRCYPVPPFRGAALLRTQMRLAA
jgi:hypothetical protein